MKNKNKKSINTLFKKRKIKFLTSFLVLLIVLVGSQVIIGKSTAEIINPLSSTLLTTGQLTVGKVSPGDQLPLQVQLINFGTPDERVDVTLMYSVKNKRNIIVLDSSETVAVQTTSSFIKNVLIPQDFPTGTYSIDLLMSYQDQEFPAISQAKFKVSNKFFGFYSDDWLLASPLILIPFLVMFFWMRRKRDLILLRPNYEHIEEEERAYYEIVHDVVVCLHKHVGDRKMKEIISHIEGLKLEKSNLYVEELSGSVEVIISKLIGEYEKVIGKKANIITKAVYRENRVKTD